MHRRDFLLFRTERARRVVELSCRRLFLRALEAEATRQATVADPLNVEDEPPAVFDGPGVRDILRTIAADLASDDVLRLVGRVWLGDGELGDEVDALVAGHRLRGGEVEVV
jgi:hypothetical protein